MNDSINGTVNKLDPVDCNACVLSVTYRQFEIFAEKKLTHIDDGVRRFPVWRIAD